MLAMPSNIVSEPFDAVHRRSLVLRHMSAVDPYIFNDLCCIKARMTFYNSAPVDKRAKWKMLAWSRDPIHLGAVP